MAIRSDNTKSVVYVLGAGASKAVIPTAPLMAQLLPEALKLFDEQTFYSHGLWSNRVQKIKGFIKTFYNLNLDTNLNPDILPNLEDILTLLDDAITEDRPLSKNYDVQTLRTLREYFVYSICEILRQRLAYEDVSGRQLMQQFIAGLEPNDSMVSLNYDIIVDNALFDYKRSKYVNYGLSIRYGLEVDTWEKRYRTKNYKPIPHPEQHQNLPRLYKLHGSLNWLYCPSCQELDVTIGMKGVQFIYIEGSDFGCPYCHGSYDPLIITPTMLKAYKSLIIRDVWRQAEDKISRADDIVFIGYSLPDADAQLRCLLSRALYKNRAMHDEQEDAHRCNVHVVGNSPPDGGTYKNEVHKRYIKLFGEVEYHSNGFQGYMDELRIRRGRT